MTRKKLDKKVEKEVYIPREETSSRKPRNGSTSIGGGDVDSSNSGLKFNINNNATKAPSDIKDAVSDKNVHSYPGLIKNYFLDKKYLPFILIVLIIGFCFIQDNGGGQLNDLMGIGWFTLKIFYIIVVYLVLLGLQYLFGKIFPNI